MKAELRMTPRENALRIISSLLSIAVGAMLIHWNWKRSIMDEVNASIQRAIMANKLSMTRLLDRPEEDQMVVYIRSTTKGHPATLTLADNQHAQCVVGKINDDK